MNELGIGRIITLPQVRDAIHVAVAPVEAAEDLAPGQRVGIRDGKATANVRESVGIVDPFLRRPVGRGEKFWLFLQPGTIHTLRHEWTHPTFPSAGPTDVEKSVSWLRNFAGQLNLGYEEMLQAATRYVRDGEQIIRHEWEGEDYPEEFWQHYEAVTGSKVDERDRGMFFGCGGCS